MGFLWWSSLFPSQGEQSLVPPVSFWNSLVLLILCPSSRSAAISVSRSISATAGSAAALPPAPWDSLWHLGVLPWQLWPAATALLAGAEDVALYPSCWEGSGRASGPAGGRTDGWTDRQRASLGALERAAGSAPGCGST